MSDVKSSGRIKKQPEKRADKPDLKQAVLDIIEDMITNEVAIFNRQNKKDKNGTLISYGKVELGGDSYNLFTQNSELHTILHNQLMVSSARNRKAVWNFILKALS